MSLVKTMSSSYSLCDGSGSVDLPYDNSKLDQTDELSLQSKAKLNDEPLKLELPEEPIEEKDSYYTFNCPYCTEEHPDGHTVMFASSECYQPTMCSAYAGIKLCQTEGCECVFKYTVFDKDCSLIRLNKDYCSNCLKKKGLFEKSKYIPYI